MANALAHPEPPRHTLSDSPEPPPGGDAAAREVRPHSPGAQERLPATADEPETLVHRHGFRMIVIRHEDGSSGPKVSVRDRECCGHQVRGDSATPKPRVRANGLKANDVLSSQKAECGRNGRIDCRCEPGGLSVPCKVALHCEVPC